MVKGTHCSLLTALLAAVFTLSGGGLMAAAEEGRGADDLMAQHLTLSSPRTNIFAYEPLFLVLSGAVGRYDKTAIDFDLQGTTNRTKFSCFGLGRFHRTGNFTNGVGRVSGAWMLSDMTAPCLTVAGSYKVKARDGLNGLESNEIWFRVSPVPAKETNAVALFTATNIDGLVLEDARSEDLLSLKDLLRNHPESRFAPYAAYALLMEEYRHLPGQVPLNFAERHPFARQLPKPSLWHSEALMTLAEAEALSGDTKAARSDYGDFRKLYPTVFATEIERRINELIQWEKTHPFEVRDTK